MTTYKFIATSDIHIRKRRPEKRIDNFYLSQKRKLVWLFKTAQQEGADVLSGGDIFDTPTTSYQVVRDYIELVRKYDVKLRAVYGQHDLRHHVYNSWRNTPLATLLSSTDNIHVDEQPFENDLVCVQGASWEREFPKPKKGKINILLTHRMVIHDDKIWEGQTGYSEARKMIKNLGFDIIVSGDNHQPFVVEYQGRYLFNTGSLVRLRIDQKDYVPKVPLVTVTENSIDYEWLTVPVKEASLVFSDKDVADVNVKEFAELSKFVESLGEYKVDKPDYIVNLQEASQKVDDGTSGVINKVIKNISGD